MKNMFSILAIAALSTPLLSQSAPATQEERIRTRTGFDLLVHAPYAATAPLFGPNGERSWAGKHWNPQFVYPQSTTITTGDTDGAVFTIQHGPYTATWATTQFDVDARHFQYVYFLPNLMVTVIDVRFKLVSAEETAVNVVYTRTALTPEGNQHVTAMTEGDKSADKEWQQAIDEYLASKKAGTDH
jgi:hypothetical protein